MAQRISSTQIVKSFQVGTQGTGGTHISDPIDIRDSFISGVASLSYTIALTNGTAGQGTAGSSTFEYLGCPVFDGTYVALGTFGTQGNGPAQSGAYSFTPITIPFIKVKTVVGTSNPIVLTSGFHCR